LEESARILKACIRAPAALAELEKTGELLPNQGLLINLIPLLKTKDSSEIENIVTTPDKPFVHSQLIRLMTQDEVSCHVGYFTSSG